MDYRIALSCRILHDYWGDDLPPLRITPHDPSLLSHRGMIAKPSEAGIDLVAETGSLDESDSVTLDVFATDDVLIGVTDGVDGNTLPHLSLTENSENVDLTLTDVPKRTDATRLPGDPFLRIDLALPETGTRKVTLHLSAVAALWAYHITGDKVAEPLQIIDNSNEFEFEDLGQSALPDGITARVFRSTSPVALRRRSPVRFTLEAPQDPPFDPITLIPVLPAAGVNLRPTDDPAAGAPLQSDIFVSLW